jgi:DNA-binding transcriptional MerR regulator
MAVGSPLAVHAIGWVKVAFARLIGVSAVAGVCAVAAPAAARAMRQKIVDSVRMVSLLLSISRNSLRVIVSYS